jgi:hypothetical protein
MDAGPVAGTCARVLSLPAALDEGHCRHRTRPPLGLPPSGRHDSATFSQNSGGRSAIGREPHPWTKPCRIDVSGRIPVPDSTQREPCGQAWRKRRRRPAPRLWWRPTLALVGLKTRPPTPWRRRRIAVECVEPCISFRTPVRWGLRDLLKRRAGRREQTNDRSRKEISHDVLTTVQSAANNSAIDTAPDTPGPPPHRRHTLPARPTSHADTAWPRTPDRLRCSCSCGAPCPFSGRERPPSRREGAGAHPAESHPHPPTRTRGPQSCDRTDMPS